jgi:hypothetical protein
MSPVDQLAPSDQLPLPDATQVTASAGQTMAATTGEVATGVKVATATLSVAKARKADLVIEVERRFDVRWRTGLPSPFPWFNALSSLSFAVRGG